MMKKQTGRAYLKIFLGVLAAAFSAAPGSSFAGGMEELRGGSVAGFNYLSPAAIAAIAAEATAIVGDDPFSDQANFDPEDLVSGQISYLTPEQVQTPGFPAPPAAGSTEAKSDLAAVLQWQKDRTSAQCAAARAQANASYDSFFGDISPFP